jgi:hypothetical protein
MAERKRGSVDILAALLLAAAACAAVPREGIARDRPECRRLRAELAAIDRQAGMADRSARHRLDLELSAATARRAAYGCDRRAGPFFQVPPPQCAALAARIDSLQRALAAQPASGATAGRRAQLVTAMDLHCGEARQPILTSPQAPRSMFDAIFGVRAAPARAGDSAGLPRTIQIDPEPTVPPSPIDTDDPVSMAPPRGDAFCVRSCDGYFFPLSVRPGRRGEADRMCQALCPAVETKAYFREGGGIEGARREDGTTYGELPNAGLFRKAYSAACTCRKPGQALRTGLSEVEDLIARKPDDIVVTPELARQMSLPVGMGVGRVVPADYADRLAAAARARPASAIPRDAQDEPPVEPEEPPLRGGFIDGDDPPEPPRRGVRIVAPGFVPVRSAAGARPSLARPRAP